MKFKIYFLTLLFSGLCFAPPAFAKELVKTDKALRTIFKEADHFESRQVILTDEQIDRVEQEAKTAVKKTPSVKLTIYTATRQSVVMGFAVEDTVKGKWGIIRYLMGVDIDEKVKDIVILDFKEIRGRGIAKPRFLKQYKGKGLGDHLVVGKDIDGITGATISSRSLTDGVRKLLFVLKELDVYSARTR